MSKANIDLHQQVNPVAPAAGASPFDAIKRTRPDGSEYWCARDLMPLMGYGADWRNLQNAIERARAAAMNIGEDVAQLFVGVTVKTGGRPREDFELARSAAYLVALNGDPRKPESAAAQAYFVARTRQAEVIEANVLDHRANAQIELAKGRMELIRLAEGIIDKDHLQTKARIVLAHGIGEAPEIEATSMPLYVQTFLREKGLSKKRIQQLNRPFGGRVKAAYVVKYGYEPKKYPLETETGQVHPANAYTEADRHLMEEVWDTHFANKELAA